MFNANPLLRYDGYYILSDVLEIPNLRQKASTILNRKLGTWCLGLEEPEDPFLPKRQQWLFALYTVASAVYRWVVTFSILYFLNKVFEPYGLKVLGPADRAGRGLRPGGPAACEPVQILQSAGEVGQSETLADVYDARADRRRRSPACCSFRCRRTSTARSRCRPANAASVYVEQPGILETVFVQPGDHVEQGPAAGPAARPGASTCRSPSCVGQRDAYQAQLDSLAQLELRPAAAPRPQIAAGRRRPRKRPKNNWPSASATARSCGSSRRRAARCCRRRWCRSKPGRRRSCRPGPARRSKPENLGATLMTGTKLCQIGDPQLARSAAGDRPGRRRVRRAGAEGRDHADAVGRLRVRQHRSKRCRREDLKIEPGASLEPARRRAADEDGRERRAAADRPGVRGGGAAARRYARTCCGSAWWARRRSRPRRGRSAAGCSGICRGRLILSCRRFRWRCQHRQRCRSI